MWRHHRGSYDPHSRRLFLVRECRRIRRHSPGAGSDSQLRQSHAGGHRGIASATTRSRGHGPGPGYARPDDSECRSGHRIGRLDGDGVPPRPADASLRQRPSRHHAAQRRPRPHRLHFVARRAGIAVADSGADGGRHAAVSVYPGTGHSGAFVHSSSGPARGARDLRRHDSDAEGTGGRHGGRDDPGPARQWRLCVQDASADPVVSHCARGGRPDVQGPEFPHGRLGRALDDGCRRPGVRRHRADGGRDRSPVTGRIAGAGTTCSSCRPHSRLAAWRIPG